MHSASPYSRDKRVLACINCLTPVESPATGGATRCTRCGITNEVPARDESPDRASAQSAPTMSEAMRFERLRGQDGKPLATPPQLKPLLSKLVDDASVGQAWNEWQAARRELLQAPSFPAAERLYFLAMGIYSYLALNQRHLEARAVAESSLDLVSELRFRQEMIARMARGAVNTGDVASAEGWFALLVPHSDDIHVDSGYRTTGAWIATANNDHQAVLRFLGARIDDIPIADTSDALCTIVRANAHERMGQVQTAVEQLVQLATRPGGAKLITVILEANPRLNLCPHSSQLVEQQLGQMQTQAVRTRGSFNFARTFIPAFVGGLALAGAMVLVPKYVDESYASILMPAMVVSFVLFMFVRLFGSLRKIGALRKRLREQGMAGSAQLIGASETGTRINNQPLVEMTLMVSLPGRPPYTAIHREIVSNIQLARLAPGTNLPVRVDANDPTLMVVDW